MNLLRSDHVVHEDGADDYDEEADEAVSEEVLSAHREALSQMRAELATAAMALRRMEWREDAAAAKRAHDDARAAMLAATEAKRGERSAALRERLLARRGAKQEQGGETKR